MDIEFTAEQHMIRKMCREFAEKEIRPVAAELDRTAAFPTEIVRKMSELGLMGVAVPPEWGGAGMDTVSYILAMEEISRACASCAVIMSVSNSLYCDPILKFGTDAQKERWLKPFAQGRRIGCFALTEPSSGSDAVNMATRAIKDGDGWILMGEKNFITNGPEADAAIVFAVTDPEKGARGVSAFIVPGDVPGLKRGPREHKLGISASGTCTLAFEDCRLPEDSLLGERGQGFKIAMITLDGGRIGIAAQALGIAQAALEAALAYAKERSSFGKKLHEHQAIQFMLADMATELDAARLLTLRAARLKDRGIRHTREASMAKLYASEVAHRITTKALQIFGGYGYLKDYPVERHFRDARITEIYEGTSEIQRIIIAADLLKG